MVENVQVETDPVVSLIVPAEVDRIRLPLLNPDRREAQDRLGRQHVSPLELVRTPGQRRHDAMVIMAQRSAAADEHSRPPDPQIFVRTTDKVAIVLFGEYDFDLITDGTVQTY